MDCHPVTVMSFSHYPLYGTNGLIIETFTCLRLIKATARELQFLLQRFPFSLFQSATMPSNEDKILLALFTLERMHNESNPTKQRVMAMSQIKSSTFAPMVSRMASKKGLVESSNGNLCLTDKGREAAGNVEGAESMPTCNEEVHESIKEKLKGKKVKLIFDILSDGATHTKASIMERADVTNPKTFAPLLSRELKKPGYIDYPSKDCVRLVDSCFPFGRPS